MLWLKVNSVSVPEYNTLLSKKEEENLEEKIQNCIDEDVVYIYPSITRTPSWIRFHSLVNVQNLSNSDASLFTRFK